MSSDREKNLDAIQESDMIQELLEVKHKLRQLEGLNRKLVAIIEDQPYFQINNEYVFNQHETADGELFWTYSYKGSDPSRRLYRSALDAIEASEKEYPSDGPESNV